MPLMTQASPEAVSTAAVSTDRLSVSLLTREYPPSIYGGAGVHVAQLVPQLRALVDVDVQCMGEPREGATAHPENYPPGANAASTEAAPNAALPISRRRLRPIRSATLPIVISRPASTKA